MVAKRVKDWNPESTFVINLDRSQARLAMFAYEMNRIGAEFRRFKALDGSMFYQPATTRNILTPNQLACFYSHLGVWQQALDSGFDEVMIFEDDCVFSDDFVKEYEEFMSADNGEWQIIRLGVSGETCRGWKGRSTIDLVGFRMLNEPLWGAHAYVVRRETLGILVNASSAVMEADYFLFGRLPDNEANLRGLKKAVHSVVNVTPYQSFCLQRGGVSTITGRDVAAPVSDRFRHNMFKVNTDEDQRV